jgi:cell fate regulator YaaT (PSP1 superfamily)
MPPTWPAKMHRSVCRNKTDVSIETSYGIYLIRVGTGSETITIPANALDLVRGDRVICRTGRGLEIGTVLCESVRRATDLDEPSSTGRFVRPADANAELLWAKLQELSFDAAGACEGYLRENGLDDVLLDVEPMLDGRTLYFHFLGEPSQAVSDRIGELAEVYRQSVIASPFAQRVEVGCGPDCGTESKGGCGTSGGCAVCTVASKCRK